RPPTPPPPAHPTPAKPRAPPAPPAATRAATLHRVPAHSHQPTPHKDESAPDKHQFGTHAGDRHLLAGLPYRLGPGERTNAIALAQPSPAAVGRSAAVAEALARWLNDQVGTDVELSGVSIHLVEDAAGVAQWDARGLAAEPTEVGGQTRIYLGPAAFDGGLPRLAKVLLHEVTRVAQLRRGETDPHDPGLYAEAEAAGQL